ncbi:MAG: PIN domain-containing protein [Polyangiaceae bacterium]|nr:PIN domain-containing protein [Polyangiaceae bacterium]
MILVDTGFWLALANANDLFHAVSVSTLQTIREPLVTTWPVMTETCHLLASRLGIEAERSFLRRANEHAFQIFDLTVAHLDRVDALLMKYADLPMDLADASLVILAETLGSGRILSTDRRDFHAYRWKTRKPFKNLLPLD